MLLIVSCTDSRKGRDNAAPSVILISIDTLRADHLRTYGYDRIETPSIDALARDGVLFRKAYAHVPITLPSHTSILTGTYPNFHGVRNNGEFLASKELNTAAEIFKSAGYDTAAFVGAFVLDSRFGLDQGFDLYDDDMENGKKVKSSLGIKERRAEDVVKSALGWLEKQAVSSGAPFLMFVHLFDPHAEYDPPEPFLSKYADNLYDGEIAYTDSQVGVLLAGLKELGLYDNTVVVLTSDHGESLGEHGEKSHIIFIYNSTIWVPLVIKAPFGKYAGKVVNGMVRHIDILPTIMEVAGIDERVPIEMKSDMQGISLAGLMGGDGQDIRLVSYAESWYPKLYYGWSAPESIRYDGYEYISLPVPEFYDLQKDPGEVDNIYETRKDLAKKYALKLEEIKKLSEKGRISDARREMDRETLAKLKSLGYIHGDQPSISMSPEKSMNKNGAGSGRDPKDGIVIHEKFLKIMEKISTGDFVSAVDDGLEVLSLDPENMYISHQVALAYSRMGKYAEAVKYYNRAKKINPHYLYSRVGLMEIYTFKKPDFNAAQRELDEAFAVVPNEPMLLVMKANLELAKGEMEKSKRSFTMASEMGERSDALHAGLGLYYEKIGQLKLAEKEYRAAIRNALPNPAYYNNLGGVLARQKRFDEAIDAIKKSLGIYPDYADAVYNLGTVYMDTGKLDEAETLLKKGVELNPQKPYTYVSLARTYLKKGDRVKAFSTFRQMTKVAPEMPLPWYQMALIAAAGNRKGEAKEYLKAAIIRGGPQVADAASNDAVLKEFVKKLK
ncbi:MAG: sulfatase-like hydrolase/transferase [Nitrospinota bacterium]